MLIMVVEILLIVNVVSILSLYSTESIVTSIYVVITALGFSQKLCDDKYDRTRSYS